MDGSFDPNSANSSIERNVEVSKEEENRSNTEETRNNNEANRYMENITYFQDDPTSPVQIRTNGATIVENNSHILKPSTSYEETGQEKPRSASIRNIEVNKLSNFELIGRGNNGNVYKCSCSELNDDGELLCKELVAVKEERGYKLHKEDKVMYEATKLFFLNHPNIIKCYGVVKKQDCIDCVVMELGQCSLRIFLNDLGDVLSQNKGYSSRNFLSYRLCIEYLLQIARGMENAHSHVKFVYLEINLSFKL